MAELKNMTVQALRELARKALGRGYTKLKTKAELIEALQAAERKVVSVADRAATTLKNATGRAARATEKAVEKVRRGRERRAEARSQAREDAATPAAKARGAAAGKPSRAGARAPAATEEQAKRKAAPHVEGAPEPDPEGYMVARVAGEDALRGAPHAMTESALEEKRAGRSREGRPRATPAARGFEEHLGELPWSYADDTLTLLARDPTTLFLFWDHSAETLRQAWEGLDGGRPQIWLFARDAGGAWARVRTIDFALESRSYYVHDLEPGRVYRAEIHLVDRHGREKLVPRVSNEMMLPPAGPSPVIDDRFLRILWTESLRDRLREAHSGGPFSDEVRAQLARLSDWSRFGGRVWGGSAGGVGGRPSSPTSSPSGAPGGPPAGWTDGEGR